MARGDQLSRQWKIIQALTSSRFGKTTAQLADSLGCHTRTVYRDLEALQQAGFPLYNEKDARNSRWSMLDGGKGQMPIPLSLTELMALYFSRNMLKALDGTAIYDSLVSLFEKVKATLPKDYMGYLKKIEGSIEVGVKARKPYRQFQHTLNVVQQAVQERTYVDMRYHTMSRNQETRRRVAPYNLWFYDETFYLIGHCQMRQEVRLFAVDRIEEIEASREHFDLPRQFDAEAFMQPSFGVFQGEPQTVEIRFAPQAAGYVKEKIWHPSQTLREEPDGSVLFSAEVAGIQEIKLWVLKWGRWARVLSPESLRREIAQEIGAMLENYKCSGPS